MDYSILVVDDEIRIRRVIGDYLRYEGYNVIEAIDGKDALNQFETNDRIDLIILDVMMPNLNGWEVCKEIRRTSDVQVLFLTALGQPQDEAYGLNIGSDDYITKPFEYEVFMARVKKALARIDKRPSGIYTFDGLEINTNSRNVKIDGQEIILRPKEYDLLAYFIKNQDIALHRNNILDAVWGIDFYGDIRTLDTHVKRTRAKLGKYGQYIKTVRSFGYKFEAAK